MCLTPSIPPFNPPCVSALFAFGFLGGPLAHIELGLAFLFPEFSSVASVANGICLLVRFATTKKV
ncbi:mCG147668 [Mus musculus]|nr:mCG147668 [Mus musculus]